MKQDEQIKNRMERRRFPNALILTGEAREELALILAGAYVCSGSLPPCGHCIHCHKAKERIHPDIQYLGGEGEALKVDQLRRLRADAYIRPNEAERKVYVVENAQSMNPQGQNALLKLLEEGPEYAAFFFLVPNPEQLLQTLRSRCETIRREPEEGQVKRNQEVEAFLALLQGKDILALVEFCVALEKKKREELIYLLDQTIEGLTPLILKNPKRLLQKLDALRQVRAACEYNIAPGHVSGWLFAALTEETSF